MLLQARRPDDNLPIELYLEEGHISRLSTVEQRGGSRDCDPDLYIAPGFFDPHVNGFAGIDFNATGLLTDHFYRAARAVASTGVTAFFPTLITAPPERLLKQVETLYAILDTDPFLSRICPAIHLEGPFISPLDGPRGIHPRKDIRPPRWDEFQALQEASHGKIRLITVAPEQDGALRFIERAAESGVVVAIGHTAASEEVLDAALSAGAALSTHLGNGMGMPRERYRNVFQKQLAMDGLMATVIADGIHLPDYVVKNIIRAKGEHRVLLTTDAISAAHRPAGHYRLGELELASAGDGAVRLAGTTSLAGSTLSLPQAITNVIKYGGTGLAAAIRMVTENGRRLFPTLLRAMTERQPANLVLFRFEKEIKIEKVYFMGETIDPEKSPMDDEGQTMRVRP
jgi:N-acetylglucosamine-6-phosphate deacetylase